MRDRPLYFFAFVPFWKKEWLSKLFLKSLEVQGFKSFPDKIVLSFEGGITGIVGPNGSGKSNIADAIRWVLGEQSTRTLRGGKMEDVIFGGTQKRGPVGFAEVSLTIDNSDKALPMNNSEVMVTRRYYRSGESEYYINRETARLKDINELFMDTGLGRDGYSIIGQGRIDEILSLKSDDRREIFEEAAGISKYRHRKEESERKLSLTDENLIRINDKISELELQVEPLREQSQKARQYLVFRDELRVLEINVWLDALDKLHASLKKTENDYAVVCEQSEQAKTALDSAYTRSEQLSAQMREKDELAEAVRNELAQNESDSSLCEGELRVLENTILHNKENIESIRLELETQEGRAGGLSGQIEERRARIESIDGERTLLGQELSQLYASARQALESARAASVRIDALRASAAQEDAAAAQAGMQLSSIIASDAELQARRSIVDHDLSEKQETLSGLSRQLEQSEEQLKQAREREQTVNNVISGYTLRLEARNKRAQAARERSAGLKSEKQALEARIHLLSEMEKEYQGYSNAVKLVMQESARGALKHIHGPISALMKTEDRFAVSIETALGAAVQNIVVDSEDDGKAAIGLLRTRDGGRATFLPLSAIRGQELSEKGLENEPGVQGIASRLVRTEDRYGDIIRSLLGRVVIIEDMDAAIRVARKYSYRFRIVTLDGQVINAGGSMTGGSAVRSVGILSRKNEIERLRDKSSQLETSLTAADKEQREAEREAAAVSFELEAASGEKRQAEDDAIRLEMDAQHRKTMCESAHADVAALESEQMAIAGRLEQNAQSMARLEAQQRDSTARRQELNAQAEALMLNQSGMQEQGSGYTAQINELNMRAAALDAERETVGKSMVELEALRQELSGDQAVKLARIDQYLEKNKAAEAEMLEKKTRLEALHACCQAKRQNIQDISRERLGLEAARTAAERETQDKNREQLNLERERGRLEQQKQKDELEEKRLLDRMWEQYSLSYSAALSARTPIEGLQQANRRIAELKKDISALGSVNVGAIEEYDRVFVRYEYLTGQRDDVQKAKGELEDIIKEITTHMRDIFAQQFKVINESFSQTFVEIFGGGRAQLNLEDESDILNCGIEIAVQPPGKQLKTITLLSGGEKAFVAIALYFAILKVRPAPFCVLDEIEAALDDVNVSRFAAYLRRLTCNTQFIVITHRRGTMDEADMLYGVTMQEQGISKLLALHLNEVEQQLHIKLR